MYKEKSLACMLLQTIPALWSQRQENHGFEPSLSDTERVGLSESKAKQNKTKDEKHFGEL